MTKITIFLCGCVTGMLGTLAVNKMRANNFTIIELQARGEDKEEDKTTEATETEEIIKEDKE